jgi:hypothetical protein
MKESLYLGLIMGICVLAMTANAQIPNAGFENWTDSYTPVDWFTNNVAILQWYTISQAGAGDSHSGSSAIRGEVITAAATPYPPLAFTGSFTYTERHPELTGWYKFSPLNGDVLVIAFVAYGTDAGGAGSVDIVDAASTFTQFSIPIFWTGAGNPDSAWIVMEIVRRDELPLNPGSYFIVDDLAFGIGSLVPEATAEQAIPAVFLLHQNYPNPFNSTTTIRYDVSQAAPVQLTVYDLLGREVANLASGPHAAGSYTVTWNAANFPSGMYLCRMNARAFSQTQKMMLVK